MSNQITAEITFVTETLVTDTVTYEIVKRTARTLTLRPTRHGDVVKIEHRDGNPYPCTWTEVVSVPGAPTKIVRLRRDGTYRTFEGGRALRPATMLDGKPVEFTDYRF